jgi:hypothetical protein
MMKTVMLLLLAVSEFSSAAEGDAAQQVAENIYFVNHFFAVDNISYGDRRHPMSLLNVPQKGRSRHYLMERHLNNRYEQGEIKARDLAIFRSGKLRSTGILLDIYKDEQRPLGFSIWLPALRKIRRHAQPDQADVWGGSVFTYGDIYLRKPDDERHELLGEVVFETCLKAVSSSQWHVPPPWCKIRGVTVLKMRSYPRKPHWWYDYRDQYIDPHSFADYRSEYYKNGSRIKVIDKAWESMKLKDPRAQYWLYWYGEDFTSGAKGMAWAAKSHIKWNRQVSRKLWSLATLRKLSR